ncbi:MobF family relaxase [Saccharothrix obliqua]|uniref:MobF family relaxase n=1 Tax=Saccharothrix obliqua TaxID=2861747 RepID=UPI001C5DEBA1|nr:MobF family relaxase [Saccharothrix obliqua]MBW4722422.1 relaxase domain-containing protein [Saccharothrix obliqua]
MLRITAVGANAVDYLVRGSGCAEHEHGREPGQQAGPERDGADYYLSATSHGEAAGRWMGSGLAMLGVRDGDVVDEEAVRAAFGRLEHPTEVDENGEAKALGRRPRRFKDYEQRLAEALEREPDATPDRQREIADQVRGDARQAVAYYDWTFSPPKTFSTQYAALIEAGRMEEAAVLRRVQHEAVQITMRYAEGHAAYTRTGYHGRTKNGRSVGKYEKVDGLTMTVWEHSTNREGEPQLHTHVAVLNRAVTSSDGKIRALDGRSFRPIKEAAAAVYERAVEDLSRLYLGYEWVTRPDGKAREIAGADLELAKQASTRREQVEERAAELVEAYIDRHGVAPSAAALKAIHQAATLETRKAKQAEQGPAAVKTWAERHRGALLAQLDSVEAAAAEIALTGHPDARWLPDQADREAILARAVSEVQHQYPTWTVGNLVAAIDKQLLSVPGLPENRFKVLEAMAREVLQPGNKFGVLSLTPQDPVEVPAVLRRTEDDRSIYRPHIDEVYSTEEHLSTERRIVAGAAQRTAPSITGPELELLRTEVEAIKIGTKPIGRDQVNAILGIASSGRAGDVLIGPAGAGKSTVVGVLSKTWESRFGGRVLGLATSQRATQVLTEEGLEAINTSQFLMRFAPDADGVAQDYVRPGDLIVVDEAGMSNTYELARISRLVEAGGGKLLYTGDHQQLSAVGAGGMLNLLATDNGKFELDEVHRFRDTKDPSKPSTWEGQASLRLRAGDTSVVSEYEDRGRLHGGTIEQMHAEAMRAYLADTIAGRESLLIVGTNAEAAELSQAIRRELVMMNRVDPVPIAELKDRTPLSVGDVIQARRNDWSIQVDGEGLVTNRLTYKVLGRDERGRLLVEDSNGVTAHLPDSYVREHVTLAYASTVHAAQGRTVDTAHAVLDGRSLREDAYVALTRGKAQNTAYLATERAPDAHEQALDVTPGEMMATVMERTGADVAAELEMRASQDEGKSLAWIGTQWDLVAKEYSADRYTDALASLVGPEKVDELLAEEAYPALMRAVRSAELAGHNAEALLAEVVTERELGTADSLSAVLRYRLNKQVDQRTPEQQVDGRDWTTFQAPVDGPVGEFMQGLAVASSDRQDELAAQVAADMPAWAQQYLGDVPDEPGQREEWMRRAGVAAAYRELHAIPDEQVSIGPAPSPENEFHRIMWREAHRALGNPADAMDFQSASEAELRETRARWAREQNWAPRFVAEELREANQQAAEFSQDAVLFRARLDSLPADSPEHARTLADVERAERLAAHYTELAYQLDEVHRARQGWYAATEPYRVADQLAAEELERRNLPLNPEPAPEPVQTSLFDVVTDDEVGSAPEPEDVEPPRAWELDPVNQPGVDAEPIEHVRWWQRWAEALRGPSVEEPGVDPNQGVLFRVERPAGVAAVTAVEPVAIEDQAVAVDQEQTALFTAAKVEEATRTWDFTPTPESDPQLRLFEVDQAVTAKTGEAEQELAIDQPRAEVDPDQGALFDDEVDHAADAQGPQAEVPTSASVVDVEVDQDQQLAVDDPDQIDLFALPESAVVEQRVLRQPVDDVQVERVEVAAEITATVDEGIEPAATPEPTLEERVTVAEALRQARAADAQRLRRETAEAARQGRQEQAEHTAEQQAEAERTRYDRDRTQDPGPERTRQPEREVDEPQIELVPQPAPQREDPAQAASRERTRELQRTIDNQRRRIDSERERRLRDDWHRPGPGHGGPGMGR